MDYVNFEGRGGFRLSETSWAEIFNLAVANGWEPLGTLAPRDYAGIPINPSDDQSGAYLNDDSRVVTDEESRALSAALLRAVPALRKEREDPDFPWVEVVEKFAKYASGGSFRIL